MRVIFHLDMDAFFASVEEKMNPHLKGKPLCVGGGLDRRGVVASANYAARPYGIRAGMPIAEAKRLCPQAVFLEGDPRKYVHLSLEILALLKDFTPAVEPFSIDEAFLDLTQVPPAGGKRRGVAGNGAAGGTAAARAAGDAALLERYVSTARAMQRAIREKTDLTASIGIATNKYIAKMGSGLEKPAGLTVLSQERYRQVFWPRGVQELWGIGEKTREALERLEIRTVGQLAHFPRELLTYHFGLNGEKMQEAARGEDDTPVTPYYEGIAVKSMGHEVTLPEDLDRREALEAQLLRLSDMVARRLRQDESGDGTASGGAGGASENGGHARACRRDGAKIPDWRFSRTRFPGRVMGGRKAGRRPPQGFRAPQRARRRKQASQTLVSAGLHQCQ